MGTFGLNSIPGHTMKVLLLTSALMVLIAADTCSDCTAVVNAVQARLMSEESIAYQQGILVSGLCPDAENVAECEEALPGFWAQIANLLWPVLGPQCTMDVRPYLCGSRGHHDDL